MLPSTEQRPSPSKERLFHWFIGSVVKLVASSHTPLLVAVSIEQALPLEVSQQLNAGVLLRRLSLLGL